MIDRAERGIPVAISVAVQHETGRRSFVIEPPLVGLDSYLAATLTVLGEDRTVRVHTLDGRTILVPDDQQLPRELSGGRRLEAVLTLRCSARQTPLPCDLSDALEASSIEFASVDPRQQAYLLAFLAEARDPEIRRGRIELICQSVPPGTV